MDPDVSLATDSPTQDRLPDRDTLPDPTHIPQNAPRETWRTGSGGDAAAEDEGDDWTSDTHVLVLLARGPDLREPAGRVRSQTGRDASDVPPPDAAAGGLAADSGDRTPEDRPASRDHGRSDSPKELWLDACQYLAGEEEEEEEEEGGAILNERGHFPEVGGAWPPAVTKVSGSPQAEGAVIGHPAGKAGRLAPPVERWSSEDSWSSALSDWPAAATTTTLLPEDFSAALAPPTRTPGPMAIQDQALEPRPSPETPLLAGQSCFSSPGPLPAVSPLQDRDAEEGQTEGIDRDAPAAQGDKKADETLQATQDDGSACPTDDHSSLGTLGHTLASERYGLDMSASSERAPIGRYEAGMDSDDDDDVGHDEERILLCITEEDGDSQYSFLEGDFSFVKIDNRKLCGDALEEVTKEDGDSQLGSLTPGGGERTYGSAALSLSHYPAAAAGEVERARGGASDPGLRQSAAGLQLPPHVTGDDADTHVSSSTQAPEEQRGGPQFITPVAPLGLDPPRFFRVNSALEGDRDGAKRSPRDGEGHVIKPRALWPTSGGITHKPPWENHEEKLPIDTRSHDDSLPDQEAARSALNPSQIPNKDCLTSCSAEDTERCPGDGKTSGGVSRGDGGLSRALSSLVILTGEKLAVSEREPVAYLTLDLPDPLASRASVLKPAQPGSKQGAAAQRGKTPKMPHKTPKSAAPEWKARSKKDKLAGHHPAPPPPPPPPAPRQQETPPRGARGVSCCDPPLLAGREDEKVGVETVVLAERAPPKAHGKKKKKHVQSAEAAKAEAEPPAAEAESGAKQKTARGAKVDLLLEAKPGAAKAGKGGDKPAACKKDAAQPAAGAQTQPPTPAVKPAAEAVGGGTQGAPAAGEALGPAAPKEIQPPSPEGRPTDDVIKRRRLSEDKFGKFRVVESAAQRGERPAQGTREEPKAAVETARKKAYSEVVKQNSHAAKEVPRVVQVIQAAPVADAPQSLRLWCQFSAVFCDHTVAWSREGAVQSEEKRSAGDESRASLTVPRASSKDLGRYQCRLSSPHGSVSLDYLLTYEVLSEIVIPAPQTNTPAAPAEAPGEEESVKCSRLMFRDNFLSDQYFGEDQAASIVTEKAHFGEGMHRRAFRARLQAGMVAVFAPGHPCVLKVHTAIGYGTNSNDEVVKKNYNLAVEECHVQNTAREYIKAYSTVAQASHAFGEVPEIIPIYLVHRPSSAVPYATLEEELMGDFVKYSVRDGKEINLLRRDSEAGQKCCAFQHWVYHQTDGCLLVTDMQGVGMKLTDVGIATCQKGYRGFRGNCATSFIEQFKALHLCNRYCELLGLKSLQPKPRKTASAPKPKAQPAPKKKTFGPTVKGKS